MAVVEAYYDIERAPVKLALTAWLSSFLEEREGQNRALLEKMWAESGMSDAELLDMEVGLREQAARLERAKTEALAGNKQAAIEAVSRENVALLGAWSDIEGRRTTGAYALESEQTRQRGATRRTLEEIKGTKIAAMQYDPKQEAQVDAQLRDYIGSGGAQSFGSLRNNIDGTLKQEDSKAKQDKLLYNEIQKLRNAQFGPPQNELADQLALSYFGDTDEKAYMAREHGFITPEQERAYIRESGAGGVPRSDVAQLLDERVQDLLNDEDPIDLSVEEGYRRSGTVPGEREDTAPPTASGGRTGRPSTRSVKVKGDAAVAGPLLSVLSDPDATDDEIRSTIDQGLAALQAKADELAALRAQKRQAPRYSGANYLLDNPNWIRSPRDMAAVEKVAGRERLAGDEFATRPGTARQAAREMVREGYDPVELGKGANYNVYAYFADTVARGEEWDDELARMPARSREIIAPYLRLPKAQAVAQLRQLAADNDVTFLDIAADAVEAAAKDPSKLGELAELAGGVAPEDEPWAARVNEAIDRAFKDDNRKELAARLTSIAAGMREGQRQQRSRRGVAAPVSPATTTREKAAAQARETYDAWRKAGVSAPDIQDRIGLRLPTSPLQGELARLHGQRADEAAAEDKARKEGRTEITGRSAPRWPEPKVEVEPAPERDYEALIKAVVPVRAEPERDYDAMFKDIKPPDSNIYEVDPKTGRPVLRSEQRPELTDEELLELGAL